MYNIVRFYQSAGIRSRIIATGLTLEQAQKHTNDDNASSYTTTTKVGKDRTRKIGHWLDGYRKA